jgi:hypothetical protein
VAAVVASTEVERAADDVFAYATDPTRFHEWQKGVVDGPIKATVDVTVEPVTAQRSRLTIAVDFTGHGIGRLLVPLVVRPEARREMPANLAALKRRLERA